jgi:hypothetical protein
MYATPSVGGFDKDLGVIMFTAAREMKQRHMRDLQCFKARLIITYQSATCLHSTSLLQLIPFPLSL